MIPKVIHYCWFGRNPLPEEVLVYIESWKKYCPDYEIVEWNEDNYDVNSARYVKEAYISKKWAFVSDFVRLDIISRYGGIYLDTDVELIKNFDNLLHHSAFAGFEKNSGLENKTSEVKVALGLGFGAEKGNPVISEMLAAYMERSFVKNDGSLDQTTIPVILTEVLMKRGLTNNDNYQELKDITIYPSEYFCPQDYETEVLHITECTYSIHHYSSSWMDNLELEYLKYRRKFRPKLKSWKVASILALVVVYYRRYGIRGLNKLFDRLKKRNN
ncbi:glycosyltransferase family 32 protein [Lactococcus lactis]|uniref:glycosyltransferase family 32 protein n=1 Tax=Lactococcus lactis TaxID=1358 RepID=UPI0020733F72|nr:glycosyltransferase [Lactococcus lactis]